MSTSSPTVLLTRARSGGIAVVELAGPRVDSPPWGVSDQQPPKKDNRADVVIIGTKVV